MCALCSSHDVKKLCQSRLNVSGVSVHGAFSWCHWNFSPTDSEGQLCPYVCMLHAPHVPSVHCMFFCSFYSLLVPFLVISGGGGCGALRGSGCQKQPGGKSQSAMARRGGEADSGTRPRCSSRASEAPSGARMAGAPAGERAGEVGVRSAAAS
jgi:hypothetical protein